MRLRWDGGIPIRAGLLIATLLVALLALVPAQAASPGVTVQATGVSFAPAALVVPRGTTVTWTALLLAHTVTTDDGGTEGIGGVANDPTNSDDDEDTWNAALPQGGSFAHTFRTSGTFSYHCELHHKLGMVGVVVVVDTLA